jgi:hypothetical protein
MVVLVEVKGFEGNLPLLDALMSAVSQYVGDEVAIIFPTARSVLSWFSACSQHL